MKKSLSRSLTFLVAAIIVAQLNMPVLAVESSTSPLQNNIVITNNSEIDDTVKVTALKAGDVVTVYRDSTDASVLGTATVPETSTEAIVSILQLGISTGSVFVTVTSEPLSESTRTAKNYPAEAISPKVENITIVNNALIPDTIKVTGLSVGDIIKIYKDASIITPLVAVKVPTGKFEAILSISQLSKDAGSVFVSLTGVGLSESTRVEKKFGSEIATVPPEPVAITVINKTGAADTVKVTGVKAGDIVKIYKDSTITTPLGKVIVTGIAADATVSVPQLGVTEGIVFVTITSTGLSESTRTEKKYAAELVSTEPIEDTITIVNNALMADTVKVTGLSVGDVVKVYNLEAAGKVLGTSTVATSKTEATVSISQISSDLGNVYVSVTSKGKLESKRVEKGYDAEGETIALEATSIAVLNKTGAPDTVKVTDLKAGDVIKVYKDDTITTPLGKVIVTGTAKEATVSISQLGIAEGSVFVTITNTALKESPRTKQTYAAESISTAPIEDTITIVNNALMADTVKVTGLSVGDVVKVYSLEIAEKVLGTATVATSKTEATVSISQISSGLGNVYVSVTNKGKLESERVEKGYDAEGETIALEATSIAVLNKTGAPDTVKVTGLKAGDVIKVYKDDTITTPLGKVIVTGTAKEATVSIAQLGIAEGSVFVTVTNTALKESTRTKQTYAAELISTAPIEDTITIVNNALMADTVKVTGLSVGDIVKVYSLETDGKPFGTTTVATGKTEATVSISQISPDAGSVYVSVTNKGKLESEMVESSYVAEVQTPMPDDSKIVAINNIGKDLVLVYGLKAGDVVKVYDAAIDGKVIVTVKVAVNQSYATLSITQLGELGGDIYISLTRTGLKESERLKKSFDAE